MTTCLQTTIRVLAIRRNERDPRPSGYTTARGLGDPEVAQLVTQLRSYLRPLSTEPCADQSLGLTGAFVRKALWSASAESLDFNSLLRKS